MSLLKNKKTKFLFFQFSGRRVRSSLPWTHSNRLDFNRDHNKYIYARERKIIRWMKFNVKNNSEILHEFYVNAHKKMKKSVKPMINDLISTAFICITQAICISR